MKSTLFSIGCAAAIFLVGCSSTQPPKVRVATASPGERSSEAMVVEFELQLQNPNNAPLELLEMHYVLDIDGRHVYEGRRDAQSTLPSGGEWTLRVPAVIPFDYPGWNNALPELVNYDLSGSLVYSAPGPLAEILLDAGIWRPKAGFDGEGKLFLRESAGPTASAVSAGR